MGGSRSKQKGGEFEREICKNLSLWVTDNKRKDVFWRSAMSGGRATVSRGEVRQAGDICSVAPEGHSLTNRCYIECKVYADLSLPRFFLEGSGQLAKFWWTAYEEAQRYQRAPVLIAKQKMLPTMIITDKNLMRELTKGYLTLDSTDVARGDLFCQVYLLEHVLSTAYFNGRHTLK